MSKRLDGLLERGFLGALGVLGIVALSLLAVFSFTANSTQTVDTGLGLFVGATILLVVGYMIGIIVLAFIAVFFLTRIWRKKS